ncbi:shikimate dehydrogenase [candidate division KSB1 bacterium]|nr:shikimate dehydrogenase [candidate division KSB1 bacterium]
MLSALRPRPSAQKLAVIGDPIAHSLSPVLQNFLIRHFDLPFAYEALHIRPAELPNMMQRLRLGEFGGINVTLPHKQAVLSYLDGIDSTAKKIGAVNTIAAETTGIIGYNTDVLGLLRSFEAAGLAIAGKRLLVLGAGGAARAAILALLITRARQIVLCNRSPERAETAMMSFANYAGRDQLQTIAWPDRIVWMEKNMPDIIINTTSLGMHPHIDASPLPHHVFSQQMTVIDLVYNPLQTVFLQTARAAGAKTINGLGMLIYQGVAALELWSQQKLDIRSIYSNVEKELQRAQQQITSNEQPATSNQTA